jgi:protein-S-isoprenylcysteine O-methyltransferase Ste14
MRLLGLLILIPSLLLSAVARAQLGSSFSVTPQAKRLVTWGLYSRIRNPIYLFWLLFLLGTLMLIGNKWLFLLLAPAILIQSWRAHLEALKLRRVFGNEYQLYRERTWF